MKLVWIRWLVWLVVVCVLSSQSGCLVIYNNDRLIRPEETRQAAQFESDEAAHFFRSEVKRRQEEEKHVVGKHLLAIPFVTLFSVERKLSENAFYNDQLLECDVNHDGFVTRDEALAYQAGGSPAAYQTFPPAEVPGQASVLATEVDIDRPVRAVSAPQWQQFETR